jgi:murein tripeptide amidase MpaA
MFQAFLLAAVAFSSALAENVSYHEHSVLSCMPEDRAQLDVLHNLEVKSDLKLDFWKEARRVGSSVDVMPFPKDLAAFRAIMDEHKIKCETMVENVQGIIDEEKKHKAKTSGSLRGSTTPYFEAYHDSTEVHAFMDDLAAEFPTLATTSVFGTTYEGKPMQLLTLSTAPGTGKKALWFDGGLHAREWIAVTTMTYLADALARGYGSNADATFMLDNFDILIAPILNVDGYDYTWAEDGDRMWRKTRSPNSGSRCVGTDPNRNWEFHWGEAGTSPQPCSDSYQGAYAASEVEVQHVQDYLYQHKDTLQGYINFHSYSQEWMSPWGYTDELPEDYPTQNALSEAATTAIKAVHNKEYIYGPIATTIYPASGSSADYTYGVCGIVYSYGVELRDTGKNGFILPAEEIIPQGEEIFAGVVAMGKYIAENPRK